MMTPWGLSADAAARGWATPRMPFLADRHGVVDRHRGAEAVTEVRRYATVRELIAHGRAATVDAGYALIAEAERRHRERLDAALRDVARVAGAAVTRLSAGYHEHCECCDSSFRFPRTPEWLLSQAWERHSPGPWRSRRVSQRVAHALLRELLGPALADAAMALPSLAITIPDGPGVPPDRVEETS